MHPGGLDGDHITAKVAGHLDYVSQLAGQLGVHDPVESYLTPALGTWSDLHAEAARWRTAATAAEDVTQRLTSPLGGLDAAWQGRDANSFLDYMRQVGLSGNDLSDAMNAMADALDKTADGIRQIVQELTDLLTDTADQSSDAMTVPVSGQSRAKQYLDELDEPAGQLHELVRDVLAAFTKLCDGVQGGQSYDAITVAHKMPTRNWAPSPQPTVPQAASPPTGAVPRPAPVPTGAVPTTAVPTQPVPTAVPTHAVPTHSVPPAVPAHTAAGAVHPEPASGTHPAAAQHVAAPHAAAPHVAAPAADAATPAPVVGTPVGGAASPPAEASGADPTTGSMSGELPLPGEAGGTGADPAASGGEQQGGGMMGGGMGGMRGGQGGDQQHKVKTRLSGDIKDLLGKPDRTAPPVIGA
ncbi:MAG TPA: WXG100 family type VII secretion target [Pseudonocardiaceae bacterium]|nr:WXG100 family type VII secretion target [Pseudonocardiaceae bacterium]